MNNKLLPLGLILSLSAHAAIDEAWQGFSAPEIMDSGFNNKLSELPLEGKIADSKKNWSSSYWPSNMGSIANRWNSPEDKEKFQTKSPEKAAIFSMSQEQLAKLSPAEKYDLLLGQYDFRFKKEVYEMAADKGAKDWAGICHGWSPAAKNHNEPTPKTLRNPDGLMIPFGSADIKGLLSFYYAFHTEEQETSQVGLRCFFGGWLGGLRGCDQDLNAGAFHIIIANKFGKQEGFLVDVDRYNEVWNQPAYGFKSQIVDSFLPVSKKAAKSAVREVRVQTEFFYVDESDLTWEPVIGTAGQKISKKDYLYRLELDDQGRIVGGVWESKDRPDFLWDKDKAKSFDGEYAVLNELLND